MQILLVLPFMKRLGIIRVSKELLEMCLDLQGMKIVKILPEDGRCYMTQTIEILVTGENMPEVNEGEQIPIIN